MRGLTCGTVSASGFFGLSGFSLGSSPGLLSKSLGLLAQPPMIVKNDGTNGRVGCGGAGEAYMYVSVYIKSFEAGGKKRKG